MQFIIKFLFLLREAGVRIFARLFEKIRDPETGKIKYFDDPASLKKVAVTAFIVFLVGIALYQVINSQISLVDGAKDFEKEQVGKLHIEAQEIPYNSEVTGDPLAKLRGELGDDYGKKKSSDDDSINPDARECTMLLEKLKAGTKLVQAEKKRLRYCLENNILELSPEELAMAKRLISDGLLTNDEKALFNAIFGKEPECQSIIDKMMINDEGNAFLSKIIEDEQVNSAIVGLLNDQSLLRKLTVQPNGLKNHLGFTDNEIKMLKELLDNCSTGLLLQMLTDPKMKELMSKLLAAATNDPNFLKNTLNSENLSPGAKDLIRRFMNGEIEIDDPDYELAKALLSSDPSKRKLAMDTLIARELGDDDLASALLKKINGDKLSPEELNLIKNYDSDTLHKAAMAKRSGNPALAKALLKQAKGETLSEAEKALLRTSNDLGDLPVGIDKAALLKALADDIAKRQMAIDALRDKLARAQAAARLAAERLAKGLPLTPEQQAALQKYAELQKKLQDMLKKLRERQERLAKESSKLQGVLDQVGVSMKTIYPSGLEIEGAEWSDCDKVRPFKLVRKLRKKRDSKKYRKGKHYHKKKKNVMTLADGTELNPDEMRFIKLFRKKELAKKKEFEKLKNEVLNPLGSEEGFLAGNNQGLNTQVAIQKGGGQGGIGGLFITEGGSLKPFKLPPDLNIPAILMNEIAVTDKGAGQKVRIKIIRDVYDNSGRVVIPRNSIAYGSSGGFDVDTGIMNLTLSTVSIGGEPLDLSLSVNSADTTSGLKGEVRDTRGKLLAGAFISSFTSGAIGAISSNFIAPYQDSELLSDSLTGAALAGTAEIAQRIAEMYAGDLQNAARVFFVPAGVKVILTPNN